MQVTLPLTFPSSLVSQLDVALTFSQNCTAVLTFGEGRLLNAGILGGTEVNVDLRLFTLPKDLALRCF